MNKVPRGAAGVTNKQFVSFIIGSELFGIDIKLINEVNPNVHIIPIPLGDAYIRGHVNIRGQVVLVIDLAVMLGRPPCQVAPGSHIIIFKTTHDFLRLRTSGLEVSPEIFGDKPIAILVDGVGDVLSLPAEHIETPTRNLNNTYTKFVEGVAKIKDDLLIIINPAEVLNYSKQGPEEISGDPVRP